jgi:hypothetical protein
MVLVFNSTFSGIITVYCHWCCLAPRSLEHSSYVKIFIAPIGNIQEKIFSFKVTVMKLDTTHLRYLSDNDFRVLTAVNPPALISANKKGRNGKQKPSRRSYTLDHSNRQITFRKRSTLNQRARKGRINIPPTKCKMSFHFTI